MAACPVQAGTGERLMEQAREQSYQEFRRYLEAGLPEAATDALLRLYHLDPKGAWLSRQAAESPELGRALARRFGAVWASGAIWAEPIL